MNSRCATLYTLSDPISEEVRYVGWTSRSPNMRLGEHLKSSRKLGCNHRTHWLHSLYKRGLKPILQVRALIEPAMGPEMEIKYIAALRAKGCNLVNGTDGGEGTLGRVHTLESKAKMAAKARGRVCSQEARRKLSEFSKKRNFKDPVYRAKLSAALKGRQFSDEHRAKIGATSRGRICTVETRAKIRAANLGRHHTEEEKNKIRAALIGRVKSQAHIKAMVASRRANQEKGQMLFALQDDLNYVARQ